MQPHKPFQVGLRSPMLAAFCLGALLPSCALKGLNDQDDSESAAANAKSLEEALAILDAAIEETAPASEINSIPLDVPVQPEETADASQGEGVPIFEVVSADPDDFATTEAIFAQEGMDLADLQPIEEDASRAASDLTDLSLAGTGATDISVTGPAPTDVSLADAIITGTSLVDPSQVDASLAGTSSVQPDLSEAASASTVLPDGSQEAPLLTTTDESTREKVVVNRPAPSYALDTETTAAIDEFRKVRTTAYSHTEADHIKYGELSAMGKPLRFGMVRSAAADWSRYPVGTRFRIVGKPYEYVIDDYGSALVGTDTIDLYKPSGDRMDDWGAREVEIEVIAWGSFGKSLEILEPRKEFGAHVKQMIDAIAGKPKAEPGQAIVGSGTDASIRPYD